MKDEPFVKPFNEKHKSLTKDEPPHCEALNPVYGCALNCKTSAIYSSELATHLYKNKRLVYTAFV